MTNLDYVTRSHVRKFLSQYARPSTLVELLDTIGTDTPTNQAWFNLVQSVHAEMTGANVGQ